MRRYPLYVASEGGRLRLYANASVSSDGHVVGELVADVENGDVHKLMEFAVGLTYLCMDGVKSDVDALKKRVSNLESVAAQLEFRSAARKVCESDRS